MPFERLQCWESQCSGGKLCKPCFQGPWNSLELTTRNMVTCKDLLAVIFPPDLRAFEQFIFLKGTSMDSTQAEFLFASLESAVVGGWAIEGRLGYGKSAVVMRAIKSGQIAAVKIFHPELIERYGESVQLERIARECRLIGASHPNLVEIYDGGKCEVTGHLFVVMELVPSKNLRQILLDVPPKYIRQIIQKLSGAAMFLEERGLVHRDIKPENIAISDDFTDIKLLDLGVLKPIGDTNLTDVDQRPFIGTLRYSSPEFLQRRENESIEGWRAITIYQIGAVLHDLLMKKEIFHEFSHPYSVLVKAVLEEIPPVFGADADLVRLCNHCLVKNPETRLELVNWQSFAQEAGGSLNPESARTRLLARQKYFQDLAESGDAFGGEAGRIAKKQMDDLCNSLAARVGILLNGLGLFPLRRTLQEVNSTTLECRVLVQFEKDERLGLPFHLNVGFRIARIDENNANPICVAFAASFLADAELDITTIEINDKLIAGGFEEIVNSARLESYFLASLDAVYKYVENNGLAAIYEPTLLRINWE